MRQNTLISSLVFLIAFSFSAHANDRSISLKQLSRSGNQHGTYKALLIGIDDYADSAIPDLTTAVHDARDMEKVLREKYGFETQLLLDDQATRGAIYSALRNLAIKSTKSDSVLIYYAGHGEIDRVMGDGWWVPVDAKGGYPVSYIDNTLVQKSMRSMKAKHVLLISDSCYSGTLFGQSRALPPINDRYYLSMYNEKSRWGMTSGNKTPVSDDGTGGHSVFAYHLIKELSQNENPYISAQELYTRIAHLVSNNSEQTPLCKPIRNTGDMGGNFIFIAALTDPGIQKPDSAISGEIPALPPEISATGDMDSVIKAREEAMRKWNDWQVKMEESYQTNLKYENFKSLSPLDKKGLWKNFVENFNADNPYSQKDGDMRSHALTRITHWDTVNNHSLEAKSLKAAPPVHAPVEEPSGSPYNRNDEETITEPKKIKTKAPTFSF